MILDTRGIAMSEKPDSSPVATGRDPRGAFDLYDNSDAQELFVDGVAMVHIGPAVSKVKFFAVKTVKMEDSVPVEIRHVILSLAIPTNALFEWTLNLRSAIRPNIPTLEAASKNLSTMLRELGGETNAANS
jgi:hypothetical protein